MTEEEMDENVNERVFRAFNNPGFKPYMQYAEFSCEAERECLIRISVEIERWEWLGCPTH